MNNKKNNIAVFIYDFTLFPDKGRSSMPPLMYKLCCVSRSEEGANANNSKMSPEEKRELDQKRIRDSVDLLHETKRWKL